MNKKDIDSFVQGLKSSKYKSLRIKDDKKNPTRELSFRNTGVSHRPAVEVEHNNQTDIYEFEKTYSTSNLNKLITKWILFSIRAKMLSGKFYLVVHKKDKSKFQKIIADKKLDIEVITI